jgi:transposase
MKNLKYAVGIDVSKDDFKVCLSVIEENFNFKIKASNTFKNNPKAIKDFWIWVEKHHKEKTVPLHFLMEATGMYHEQIAWYLHQKSQIIHVILANKSKYYLKSLGIKSKNDKMDAQGLSQMCAEKSMEVWKPVSKNIYVLRSLTRLHEDIQIQKNGFRNRLEALEHSMYDLKDAIKSINKLIGELDSQLEVLSNKIKDAIESDDILKEKYRYVSSIKGIGLMAFAVVVAETDGFALIENQRQLTSYAGYDIVENQSGKRSGRTRISKKGNTHIRRILHLPAFNVVKYETTFKEFYQRVYDRSGIKMKAYVAVQRKLLCIMYTLWNKQVIFEPDMNKKMLLSEVNV